MADYFEPGARVLRGSGASDVRRTVFAVGDEKQSIYSFQGAAPKMFAETGERFAALALSVADAVETRVAQSVVPDGGACAGSGRSGVYRCRPDTRSDRQRQVHSARRKPARPCRPCRNLADRKGGRSRTSRSVDATFRHERAVAGQSSRRVHRREHRAMAQEWRTPDFGRSPDPRRRHPDPGPQASSVRRADGRRIEAARDCCCGL